LARTMGKKDPSSIRIELPPLASNTEVPGTCLAVPEEEAQALEPASLDMLQAKR
jgi:hypothetical protein